MATLKTEYKEQCNLDKCYTDEQIADILGISRPTVTNIKNRALRKCKAWCDTNGLTLEDLLSCCKNTTIYF